MSEASRSSAPAAPPRTSRWAGDFSDVHKESFAALSASMSFVGVCLMLLCVLLAIFALGALASGFPAGAGVLAVVAAANGPAAWWTMSAGRSLSALARTRGGDVDHLMEAVGQMRLLFGFLRAAIIIEAMVISAGAGLYVWCAFVLDKGGRCLSGWP